jgi:hypothetical protein
MEDVRTYLAAPGFVIRDPRTKQRVPHDGEGIRVEFSPFWLRREADGSVLRLDNKAPKRAAKEG